MGMSDMDSQIANAQAGLEKDKEDKAKALKDKAAAEGDLADTIVVRDEDQKFLDDTMATCTQKASDFEARQQLRAEEIEAIEKAIEIISSSAVSGAAPLACFQSSAIQGCRLLAGQGKGTQQPNSVSNCRACREGSFQKGEEDDQRPH